MSETMQKERERESEQCPKCSSSPKDQRTGEMGEGRGVKVAGVNPDFTPTNPEALEEGHVGKQRRGQETILTFARYVPGSEWSFLRISAMGLISGSVSYRSLSYRSHQSFHGVGC